ncbi:uncharacterized protein [Gossypium hirsutum]|uniref:DNA/RNA polymerases superfamily protein n=1 Tax=Gossypium hirsutum TaxID=3635 RepID=A0A1U8PLZ4_GOSHI|nr:uncharacterized protein LOC107960375 [Gossypium hirsutum]
MDETLGAHLRQLENGETSDFGINSEGVLCFRGRICIPKDDDLRQSILREAHGSLYAMHPGGNKMYQNLRELYWWPGLKREVMEFVSKCLVSQKVEAENQLPSGLLQLVKIPLWKCRTPTCWMELDERRVLGIELVADTENKVKLIRDRLKEASDRQKLYAGLKRHEIEYAVGDLVFLKVSLWKKVLRFGRKRKLSPRFIRPYRVVRRIGPVGYQL